MVDIGSYGVLPEPVRRSCDALSRTIEGNPDKFIRLTYLELMINTRARLTQMIGADSIDEVVLVNNASHGINTVLRNFEWKAGDVIIDGKEGFIASAEERALICFRLDSVDNVQLDSQDRSIPFRCPTPP